MYKNKLICVSVRPGGPKNAVMAGVYAAYLRQLGRTPVRVKALQAGVLLSAGDAIGQVSTGNGRQDGQPWDWRRTGAM